MAAVSVSNTLRLLDEAIRHLEQARIYMRLSAYTEEDMATALAIRRTTHELKTARTKITEALDEIGHD